MIESNLKRSRGSLDIDPSVDHAEGAIAQQLEHCTAKLPSDVWLWAAAGAMGLSLACRLKGMPGRSLFIGQWAAPLLIIGVYNKLVKVGGSDRMDR